MSFFVQWCLPFIVLAVFLFIAFVVIPWIFKKKEFTNLKDVIISQWMISFTILGIFLSIFIFFVSLILGKISEVNHEVNQNVTYTRIELSNKIDKLGDKIDKLGDKIDKLSDKIDRLDEKSDKHYYDLREIIKGR